MNKKLAAALSGGAVLVMMATLSGCGDDAEDKAKEWSKNYCPKEKASLDKQKKADQTIGSTTADGKPEDIKKADSAAFQQMVDADQEWIKALRDAGPPPIKDGEASHKSMIDGLQKRSDAFGKLKKQSDALDTKNLSEFSKGLDKLGADLGKAMKITDQRVFCPSNAGAGAGSGRA